MMSPIAFQRLGQLLGYVDLSPSIRFFVLFFSSSSVCKMLNHMDISQYYTARSCGGGFIILGSGQGGGGEHIGSLAANK